MDLGVTMGISLRFKAAQPYFWREKKEFGRQWSKNKRQEAARPRETRFPPASLRQAWGGGRERACACIWVLPYGVFSSRAFPAAPEKTVILAATVPALPTLQPASTSEGTQKPQRWPLQHPVGGPGCPSSPLGPRRVLRLTSGVCVAARACPFLYSLLIPDFVMNTIS